MASAIGKRMRAHTRNDVALKAQREDYAVASTDALAQASIEGAERRAPGHGLYGQMTL